MVGQLGIGTQVFGRDECEIILIVTACLTGYQYAGCEEAERCVTLLQQTRSRQISIARLERLFAAMLGDDQCAGRKETLRGIAKIRESGPVFFGCIVWRIEEDQTKGPRRAATKASGYAAARDLESRCQAQLAEVRAENLESRGSPLRKKNMTCAPTERLDANGTRPGVKVGEAGPLDTRS